MKRLFIMLLLLPAVNFTAVAGPNPTKQVLFSKKKAGYNYYRIPSLYTTQSGTIIALSEGRNSRSDQAHNDIVIRRSKDNGKTWDEQRTIVDYGYSSVNNPCLVQDRRNGRIYLFYQVYSIGVREKIAGDLFGSLDCQAYYITSNDDGENWTEPIDATPFLRADDEFMTLASGPGIGIQISDGEFKDRLIIPFNQGPWGKWKVFCLYSDDGETWHKSKLVPDNAHGMGNEAQVVELSDGSLMINARGARGQNFRKTAYSIDGGETWSTFREEEELTEPECMASIIRYQDSSGQFLLFSNPADSKKRRNGTVFRSEDDGINWNRSKLIEPGFFAYSCLTQLPDGNIGVLYETKLYKRIVFTSFHPDLLR